jgi:AcrR family transcriptional regulator
MADQATMRDDTVDEMRAADGRVPGRRGMATRQRLLTRTADMLRTTSYRDLKVIDIAREAGTSPATFYQYFADAQAAILVLAEDLAVEGEKLARIVADGSWKGRAGYQTTLDLVDAFVEFWGQHRPVLRVVELSATEGDRRFQAVRGRLLDAVAIELAAVIEGFQADGRMPGIDARANAGVVVTLLANVASHQGSGDNWGLPPDHVRASLAHQAYWGVTGQKPPARP